MTFRMVVVTGGRYYENRDRVYEVLDGIKEGYGIAEIGHGSCPYGGADILAEDWAKDREIPYRGYPALFKTTGLKAAGPIRNGNMLDYYKPDLVVAFPGDRGTKNCVEQAEKRGIPVTRIDWIAS